MTDKKWGGKREGAGRPKGTNNKKQYTFRLSIEELKAVREVLAKMRGKLVILFCLLTLCLPCHAIEEPNNVELIKQEAFKGIYKYCPFANAEGLRLAGVKYELKADEVLSIQQTSKNIINVVYKKYPSYTYTYKVQKKNFYYTLGGYYCQCISVNYENKVAVYHASSGRLIGIRYAVSPDEDYMFDFNGNLIEHREGDKLQKAKISGIDIARAINFVR